MADRRFAWVLIVAAVLVRAGLVLALRSHEVPRSTYEHGEIAENLLSGRGFAVKFLGADGPTSQQAPVYPLLVAEAYSLGGIGTPRSLLILELSQALLGGWLVWGVMNLVREIAPGDRGKWAVRMAGFVVAFHPTLVYAATHVQVALLAAALLTQSLLQGYRAARTGTLRDAGLAGLWLGLLMLTDPILGLASFGVAWVMLRGSPDASEAIASRWISALKTYRIDGRHEDRRPKLQRLKPLAVTVLTAGLVLLPWTVRNYRVHGEFIAVKSTFGYAFWQGNCSLSEGTDKVVRPSVDRALSETVTNLQDWNKSIWKARHEAGYIDDIALTKRDYRLLGGVSEPERSRILFRRALADLHAEPIRFVKLSLRRLRYFVFFDETNPKTRNFAYRVSHLTLTVFALLGLAMMPRSTRNALGPTFLTVALIAIFHSLTIVSARFHIPIEPLMAVWCSLGLLRLNPLGLPTHHTHRDRSRVLNSTSLGKHEASD